MRRNAIAIVALLGAPLAGAAGQAAAPPISTPVAAANLVAVFGDRPLVDSAIAVLTRDGFSVADRSSGAIAAARRAGTRLPPASLAVVVAVRYDTLSQHPILVAELLNVTNLARLRLASVHWPAAGQPWGEAMAKVMRQVMQT